jgi:hypothetical protein
VRQMQRSSWCSSYQHASSMRWEVRLENLPFVSPHGLLGFVVCSPSYTGKWAIDQAVHLYWNLSFLAFCSLDNAVNFELRSGHFEDCNFESGYGRWHLLVCSLGTRDYLMTTHHQTTQGNSLAERGCKRWCLTPDDNPLVVYQSTS